MAQAIESVKGLERRRSKSNDREQGYQQGRVDTLGYLHKVWVTLAQEFQEDS